MTSLGTAAEAGTGVSHHAYPASAMVGDYLRSAAGLVPAAILFATMPIGAVPGIIIGGFGTVFAVFGARTALRHQTRIEMTARGLQVIGLRTRSIAWADLDRFRLAYYSTRRDRRSGWMQLEVGAGSARVNLDSRIDGFDRIVRRASDAAAENGVDIGEATAANLESLGIKPLLSGERW